MSNIQKCAIIGCGFVGATTAFTLAQNGLFSEIVLIDYNKEKAIGESMDLNDGLAFTKPVKIYAGDYDNIKDCGVVIIAAGANQKPNETRIDLVNKNVKIFKSIIPNIVEKNKDCILLVLSNPVDILTYTALKLSGFDKSRVIGSGTVLDTARLKHLLGQYLNVDNRHIHAFMIGEHGDSELAVWSSANVSGISIEDFCKLRGKDDSQETFNNFYVQVRDSAYKIINYKGATYYAIAMAALRICECIVRDENSVLTVSSLVDDHYAIQDVCLGLPAIVGRSGIQRVLDIPLSEDEQEKLIASAKTLKDVIKSIDM